MRSVASLVFIVLAVGCAGASESRTEPSKRDQPTDAVTVTPEIPCGEPNVVQWNSARQVEELSSGCTRYVGSLHISDSGFRDLSVFSNLRAIDGSLTLFRNERLESLHGLEQLETVGERFSVAMSERLTDLSALSRLRRVGGSFAIHGTVAKDIRGLEVLRSVGGLSLVGNTLLRTLDGFTLLEQVDGEVTIRGNTALHPATIDTFLGRLTIRGIVDVAGNASR